MPSLNQIKGGESLFTDLPTIPSLKLTSPRSEGEFHFWERFSFREILVGGFKYFLCSPLFSDGLKPPSRICQFLGICIATVVCCWSFWTNLLSLTHPRYWNRNVFIGVYREQQPPNFSSAMGHKNIPTLVQVSCKRRDPMDVRVICIQKVSQSIKYTYIYL